ncbi:hypothetical protein AX14_000021 [Amanita brunnescens Koide BX004]|nr:hypothetical protein AX14_000021 [Amanita brunnescens Koide BX004]
MSSSAFKSTLASVAIPRHMTIELTDTEDSICSLLDACSTHLSHENIANVTCRIAGGWVRDKLLGLQCNDIDIALSDMMGLQFAEHLASFANQNGVETGTISRIAQNPDQSKHLETATLKLFGLNIDLVNLRDEEYSCDSRIPTQVSFGTPLQDALRRDITINALFYNIHTRSVEDFTEKGLTDLGSGTIRTPLSPKETFLDDPLRVLRCIRFAGRFGFSIVPEIKEAAKDPAIQDALVSKVTRERVGEELDKMMRGRDPLYSIQLIHDLSLYHTVFSVIPAEIKAAFSEPPAPDTSALISAIILHDILHESHLPLPPLHSSLFRAIKTDPSCVARLYLASMLNPFAHITYTDKKQRSHSATGIALRESLKLGTQNHYLDGIPSLFSANQLLRNALHGEGHDSSSRRVALGTLLRHKTIHNPNTGSHWTSTVLFSLVQDLIPCYMMEEDKFDDTEASKVVKKYNVFLEEIEQLDLCDVTELRPIINGRELLQVLGVSKGGSWTSELMTTITKWQLENPRGTKDDCIAWIQSEKSAGRLHLQATTSEPACKRVRTQ